jgi:hypothetical protein
MSTELVPHEQSDVLAPMPSFRVTKTGLVITGDAPPFDEWSALVGRLYAVRSAGSWALGDALNFGESRYGEKYSQVLDAMHISYGTARNVASVAARIDLSRRRDGVSFWHHVEVAALDPVDADRLLDEAERHQWPREMLREEVRALKGTTKTPTAIDAFAAALHRARKALDVCDESIQLAAADHLSALLKLVAPSSRQSVDTDPKPRREMSPTPSTDDVKDASVDLEAPILAYVQSAATCKCKVRVRDIARQPEMAAWLPKTPTRAYAIVRSTLHVLARRGLVRRDGEWWTLAVASSAMATGIDDVISI